MSFPFHVLVISFFPFHVIQVARNPQIQELYFILAKPSIQEVLRSNLESFGHGYTPQEPEKQISKGSRESFSWFFFFEVVRISFPYMCIQFRFFHVTHFLFMSFHELKLDASPNLQTTKFVPFFDVLFEKDKTKANPTPSQFGKGAPHRSPKVMKGD